MFFFSSVSGYIFSFTCSNNWSKKNKWINPQRIQYKSMDLCPVSWVRYSSGLHHPHISLPKCKVPVGNIEVWQVNWTLCAWNINPIYPVSVSAVPKHCQATPSLFSGKNQAFSWSRDLDCQINVNIGCFKCLSLLQMLLCSLVKKILSPSSAGFQKERCKSVTWAAKTGWRNMWLLKSQLKHHNIL